MKKLLLVFVTILFALPFSACGAKNAPQNFYSMVQDKTTDDPANDHSGTMMLGMSRGDSYSAYIRDDLIQRFRYDADNKLVSMTAKTKIMHPVGIDWTMTKDDIIAFYAKDPEVTYTEGDNNLMTFTKTIDGTVYYARYVLYNDGTIFQVNLTTDPTIDPMEYPRTLS